MVPNDSLVACILPRVLLGEVAPLIKRDETVLGLSQKMMTVKCSRKFGIKLS